MWTTVDSPAGPIRITCDGTAITAIEFTAPPHDDATVRSSMRVAADRNAQRAVGERDDTHPLLAEAARQLTAYFAGDLHEFDLPLRPGGTPFQERVWEQLRTIGYGRTASYGEIAARLGMKPGASRAVGAANGRNPISIVVPCHRVLGAGGALTGFGGGVERKRWLVAHEARTPAPNAAGAAVSLTA